MDIFLESMLILTFFIGYPIVGWFTYDMVVRHMAEGRKTRVFLYAEVILVEWAATALLAVLWWHSARPASALGLGFTPSLGAWVAVAVAAAIVWFLARQTWGVYRRADLRAQTREQIGPLDTIMPRNRREMGWFVGLSVTAGFCEELLFRGFLFWWLDARLGLGTLGAAVVSTVIFGLMHSYQGWSGMVRTGAVGGVMMGLYWLAGSIWPVVVLHVLVDVLGGVLGFLAFSDPEAQDPIDPEVDSAGPALPARAA